MMLLYKTETGDIPEIVASAWKDFAVDYALLNNLDTKPNIDLWEVPCIVESAFPAVGALIYQHDNGLGNCRKVLIMPGAEQIRNVEEVIGLVEDCEEIDYAGGMALPLHRHPKLAYDQEGNFFGSVLDEIAHENGNLYRVRVVDGNNVESRVYRELLPTYIMREVPDASGLVRAFFVETEYSCTIPSPADYPPNLQDLEHLTNIPYASVAAEPPAELITIRTGKQEQFIGHSDVPTLLGGYGLNNLDSFNAAVPALLEMNVGVNHRELSQLQRGEVSEPIDWHWLLAGQETSCVGELSGMPHLGKGSEDAGDLYYSAGQDPLHLKFMRTKVMEGH